MNCRLWQKLPRQTGVLHWHKEREIMMTVWAAVITSVVAPVLLFLLQWLRESRGGIKQDIQQIRADNHDTKISVLRLELLNAIQHNPDDEITILALYDKYTRLGGNSYIRAYVQRWKQERRQLTGREPKGRKCSKK